MRRWLGTALGTVAIALLSTTAASAQTPLLVDRSLTVGAGASIATVAADAIAGAEELVVPPRLFDERGVTRRTANIAYRVLRYTLFDLPQERWIRVANHEVFGHGGRLRERFDGPIRYGVDPPPPYGRGGGVTYFEFDRPPSVHEILAVTAGGMEANATAADALSLEFVNARRIRLRESIRYLAMRLDSTSYILHTRDSPEEAGHDVSDFIQIYNELAAAAGASPLKPRTLRREVLVSLADPTLVYALVGIGRFIAAGTTESAVPMLRVGPVRYLPSARYRLVPFGTEWTVVNDMVLKRRRARVELRTGRSPGASPWGIALELPTMYQRRRWSATVLADIWRQPRLALDAEAAIERSLRSGGELRARVARSVGHIGDRGVDIAVEVGGKSRGYAPGEPLAGGPLLRVGVSVPLTP